MFTPNQKIHDLLKNKNLEILTYLHKLEAIVEEFEAVFDTIAAECERNKIPMDPKISNLRENIKKTHW